MQLRLILIISSFTIISGIIAFTYYKGIKSGYNSALVKQQANQLLIQNTILNEKQNITKRKAANRIVSTNDNLLYLKQTRCSDCESKWLLR